MSRTSRRVRARDHERVPARRRVDVHERDRALARGDHRRRAARPATIAQKRQSAASAQSLGDPRPRRTRSPRSAVCAPRRRTPPRAIAASSSPMIGPGLDRRAPARARPHAATAPGGHAGSQGECVGQPHRATQPPGDARSPPSAPSPRVAQPIGDRQQRHVDLDTEAARVDRRTSLAATPAPRGRGSRGPSAGARARRRGRAGAHSCAGGSGSPAHPAPGDVMSDEGDPPVGAERLGDRLGDVVHQRPDPQRRPPRQRVRQRLSQQRGDRFGMLSPSTGPGPAAAPRPRRGPRPCARTRHGGGSGSAPPRARRAARAG